MDRFAVYVKGSLPGYTCWLIMVGRTGNGEHERFFIIQLFNTGC